MMQCKKTILVGLLAVVFSTLSLQGQRYLSEEFSAVDITQDVEYSQNYTFLTGTFNIDTLYMDVYEPMGDTVVERPLVLFLHSGSFLPPPFNGSPFGMRRDSAIVELGKRMARMGYVFAALDYRLGWNPASTDFEARNETFVQAHYRGIQDVSAGVKYFKHNYTSLGNTFAIDTHKIVVGGFGEGGSIATCFNFLDDYSELNTPRMISPSSGISYVDTSLVGRWDGALNRPENMDNYPGISASASMALNIGGLLLDTLWIDTNAKPIVSMASPMSLWRPYENAWIVIPSGGGSFVAEVDGAGSIHENLIAQQNNAIFNELDCSDTISALAAQNSNGVPGLYPFLLSTPASGFWNWWDTTDVNHASGLFAHPNMSPALGRSYLDTIVGYSAPRMVKVLFEPERNRYFDGISQQTTGLSYMDIENGGGDMKIQAFDTGCGDSLRLNLGFVTGFSLGMESGGSCPNLADGFEVDFNATDPTGQPLSARLNFEALQGSGNTAVSYSYSPLSGSGSTRVEIFDNGQLVSTQFLQASGVTASIAELPPAACLDKVDFRARGQESGWELSLANSVNIVTNGAGSINGDEIRIYPDGAGVPEYVFVEEATLVGTGLDDLAVDAEWVQKFNVWHEAVGETQYEFAKDSLTIGNIGTSGADGVTLNLPGELTTKTRFSPVAIDLVGSVFSINSEGMFNGASAPVGNISITGLSGNDGRIEADFSALGGTSYTVSLGISPSQIGSSESFSNGATSGIQNVKKIKRLETELDIANGSLSYWIYFDGAVDAVLSGLAISGNVMRISPNQPITLPTALSEIDLLGSGLNGSFTIVGNDSIILEKESPDVTYNSLTLYPNPAQDYLYIRQLNPKPGSRLESIELIGLLSGKVLMRDTNPGSMDWKLDIADLPAGVYLLRGRAKKEIYLGKFIKQ